MPKLGLSVDSDEGSVTSQVDRLAGPPAVEKAKFIE